MERSMRVLLVQDSTGHSTGYHVISRGLRDAGVGTVLGEAEIPRAIARLAVDESADSIGYRIMDASPTILLERLMEELERVGLRGIPVVVGGIVPEEDLGRLEALGGAGAFHPRAPPATIAPPFPRPPPP